MKKLMLGVNKQLLAGALLTTAAFAATQAYALSSNPLDLTVEGSSGTIESVNPIGGGFVYALYGTSTFSPSGTGKFPAFLQVQQTEEPGKTKVTVERGINGTGQAMDEGPSEQHNYPILLSDIPIVTVGGTDYRSFLLDINESNNDNDKSDNPYISIDQIKIFLSDSELASSAYVEGTGLLTGANLIYDMSSNDPNNWIKFYDRHHGSGQADMFALIPDALFDPNKTYLYLFSAFGYQGGIWEANTYIELGTNAGFEEWAAGPGGSTPIPEPATMLLFGTGLAGLAGIARRKVK